MPIDYVAQGKANKKKGDAFELRVRADLNVHYHIAKFPNNVDLDTKDFTPAKSTRFRSNTHGFPDFILFSNSKVQFVECKSNGTLKKIEKQKCQVLKDMGFIIRIASNDNGKIKYRDFVEYKEPKKASREEARG